MYLLLIVKRTFQGIFDLQKRARVFFDEETYWIFINPMIMNIEQEPSKLTSMLLSTVQRISLEQLGQEHTWP